MKTVDLFCGCGGLSLGFQNCGYEIVGAFDCWKPAIDCYTHNFNHRACELNLSKKNTALKAIRPLNPEVIIGGPPCQDFSSAGFRQEGDRANLTISFAKIVKSIKPKYFVMENVSRAKLSDTYSEARKLFKIAGYGLTEQILDASKCGVPQKRKRFFCVGALGEDDGFLDRYITSNQCVLPLTMREYFLQNQYELTFTYYYRHPRSYSRRAIFSIDEPAATIRGVNRPKPRDYKPHRNDAACADGINALTTKQRALLQTFPPTFEFCDNQAIAEQLIGNAVPVNLAAHVAKALAAFDQKLESNQTIEFADWLQSVHKYSPLAAKDVISRLGRCNRTIPFDGSSLQEYNKKLELDERIKMLSKTVQSQLKRAIRLYYEYNETLR